MNSSDIKRRAVELSEKTNSETISPQEVGGIMYDTVSYMEDVQRNSGSLGIRKTYTSVSAMEADTNPKDSEGNPLKKGMLVNIYNPANASDPDNNKVYAYNAPGWVLTSKLDAGYATRAETDAKFSELEGEIGISNSETLENTDRFICKDYGFIKGFTYKINISNASENIYLVRITNADILGDNYILSVSGDNKKEFSLTYECKNSDYPYLQVIASSAETFSANIEIISGIKGHTDTLEKELTKDINIINNLLVNNDLYFFKDEGLYRLALKSVGTVYNGDIDTNSSFRCLKINIQKGDVVYIKASKLSDSVNTFFVCDSDNNVLWESGNADLSDGRLIEIIDDSAAVLYASTKTENISTSIVSVIKGISTNIDDISELPIFNDIVWKDGIIRYNLANNIATTTGGQYSTPVSVKANNLYYFNIKLNDDTCIVFMDKNDKVVHAVSGQYVNYHFKRYSNFVIKSPFNAAKVILSALKDSITNIPFKPYREIRFGMSFYGYLKPDGNTSDGDYLPFKRTDKIQVIGGDKWGYVGSFDNGICIGFYDKNDSFLPEELIQGNTETPYTKYIEIKIPDNAVSMIATSRKNGELEVYRKHACQCKREGSHMIGLITKYDILPPEWDKEGDYFSVVCEKDETVYIGGYPCTNESKIMWYNNSWIVIDNILTVNNLAKDNYDVCIIGAGSGGIGAAYALKDSGLRVCMIDRDSMIGGTVVNAYIDILAPTTAPKFLADIYNYLAERGYAYIRDNDTWDANKTYNDTFATYRITTSPYYLGESEIKVDRYEYARKIKSDLKNIDIICNAKLESVVSSDGLVESVTIRDNITGGQRVITAGVFIDSSGGELAILCNSSNGDIATINDGYYIGTDSKSMYDEDAIPAEYEPNKYAINNAEINYSVIQSDIEENDDYISPINNKNNKKPYWDSGIVMATQVTDDGVDSKTLIDRGYEFALRESVKKTKAWWKSVKMNNNLYSNCAYFNTSSIGVRELYRIACDKMLSQKDLNTRINPDELSTNIACATWFVDLHVTEGVNDAKQIPTTNAGVPFETTIPKYLKNVLIGCKAIGASHIASSFFRLSKTVMMIGNAVGYAAEYYCKNNLNDVRNVDVAYIQSKTQLSEQAKITNDLLDSFDDSIL